MVAANIYRKLSDANLQQVLLVCEQLHKAEPPVSFVSHCQAVMQEGFSSVHFSAERYTLDPFHLAEQPIQSVDDTYLPLFEEHILDHPYAQRMPTLAAPETGMTQLEPTVQAFRKSALYNEFYDQIQAQNQIWVGLRDGNELLNCAYSRELEFTEEHLAMMCLIQPHIESAWKNWRRTRSLKQELDLLKETAFQTPEEEMKAESIRKAMDALSPRQRDVVELVADGKDNQQIADELKISVLTVKKHLQTIFQSLEVQHRTQLAAQWHKAHSVKLY